jgi:tRNA A64-2'-O-ribosylphosphate transferase
MATSLPSEELSKRYLFLNIPEGKKGQHVFFESIPKMLKFVTEPLSFGKKVLFHCAQGNISMANYINILIIFVFRS